VLSSATSSAAPRHASLAAHTLRCCLATRRVCHVESQRPPDLHRAREGEVLHDLPMCTFWDQPCPWSHPDACMLSQEGKMVHELRPAVDWNKGHAVQWLLSAFTEARAADAGALIPIYIGDDVADEDVPRRSGAKPVDALVLRPTSWSDACDPLCAGVQVCGGPRGRGDQGGRPAGHFGRDGGELAAHAGAGDASPPGVAAGRAAAVAAATCIATRSCCCCCLWVGRMLGVVSAVRGRLAQGALVECQWFLDRAGPGRQRAGATVCS
jgi:hypothetical protein